MRASSEALPTRFHFHRELRSYLDNTHLHSEEASVHSGLSPVHQDVQTTVIFRLTLFGSPTLRPFKFAQTAGSEKFRLFGEGSTRYLSNSTSPCYSSMQMQSISDTA
jgi:hypothetical protein